MNNEKITRKKEVFQLTKTRFFFFFFFVPLLLLNLPFFFFFFYLKIIKGFLNLNNFKFLDSSKGSKNMERKFLS